MRKVRTRPWDAADYLKTDADIDAYLEAALEDGDPQLITAALGDIAKAKGVTKIATSPHLTSPHLDRFPGKRPVTFRTRIQSRTFFPRGYPERSRGDLPAPVALEPARTDISVRCAAGIPDQGQPDLPGSFWAGRLLE